MINGHSLLKKCRDGSFSSLSRLTNPMIRPLCA
jgi:hypothetical protein